MLLLRWIDQNMQPLTQIISLVQGKETELAVELQICLWRVVAVHLEIAIWREDVHNGICLSLLKHFRHVNCQWLRICLSWEVSDQILQWEAKWILTVLCLQCCNDTRCSHQAFGVNKDWRQGLTLGVVQLTWGYLFCLLCRQWTLPQAPCSRQGALLELHPNPTIEDWPSAFQATAPTSATCYGCW